MRHHLRTFYVLTVTQVLSLIGSGMTHVAVGIRVFDDTGDSTPLLLASFFGVLPLMIGGSLAAAPRADRERRGPDWEIVAPLVGSRPGSGMGLLMVIAGGLIFVLTAVVYVLPKTRSVEADLLDYAAAQDMLSAVRRTGEAQA